MKVHGCVLDFMDASHALIAYVQNPLEVPDVTAVLPSKFVLPRLPRKTLLHENTSPFLELRNGY